MATLRTALIVLLLCTLASDHELNFLANLWRTVIP